MITEPYIFAIAIASGITYAVLIALFPLKSELTWLSVVIGVGMTISFFGIWEFVQTQQFVYTMVIFAFFACTGLPMIIGQIIKHALQKREAERYRAEEYSYE